MASHTALVDLLQSRIPSQNRSLLCKSVVPTLLDAILDIGRGLRTAQKVSLAGTANAFGDEQLNVDVLAEKALRDSIAQCAAIVAASSEEDPVERSSASRGEPAEGGSDVERYTIAFDPLDGSSIIAPNWTVGTIIGIWDGESALQSPSEKQVAAILGVYGPRTTAIVALRIPEADPVCIEVGLNDDDEARSEILRSDIKFASLPVKTKYFAPANLRAAADDPKYLSIVTKFIQEKYTLRYSGGLVPDVVHALVKGHGVYISPTTASSKAKLRRLYELFPLALVVECAGGLALDPADGEGILDGVILDCDERGGLICGTAEDVEFVKDALLK